MNWNFSPVVGALNLAVFLSVYVAYQTGRRRGVPAASVLFLMMCANIWWAVFITLEMAAVDPGLKVTLEKLSYLGGICTPSLLFVFILEYIESPGWLTWRNAVLLAVIPVIAAILTWTNEWHRLIWFSITPDPRLPGILVYTPGPGHVAVMAYDYLLGLIGIYLLAKAWRKDLKHFRSRLAMILLSMVFPLVAGILEVIGPPLVPGLELSPLSFSISGLILAYGIFNFQLFTILPIARDLLIENMRDGVLVLNSRDRVVDINRAAQKIIGISAVNIIGRSASELPHEWPAAVGLNGERPSVRKEVRIEQPIPLFLDFQITPITLGRKKKMRGRLIVFRDVTSRRKSELELARRAEEFLVINRISTIITSGLDLDHVLRILHKQCAAVVPSDVFYVALYDEGSDLVHLPMFYEGEYKNFPPLDLHKQPGLTSHIIETGQTLYVPDMDHPPAQVPLPIRMGGNPARSYIGIPLILREKVSGVLSVQSYQPNAYASNQIRMLEAVAIQAAIAIENARLYGEVQRLAIVDELTRVYNFRGLMELGRREVERARRFNRPLTALFFDIDGFRNFNNVYSHATGNIVLEAVAERCRSVLRSVDILSRYGGDEFVILLPETDINMALVTAKRLREEVAATKVKTTHGELSVTISLGVAGLKEGIHDIGILVDQANRAEHRAKEKGNVVEVDLQE